MRDPVGAAPDEPTPPGPTADLTGRTVLGIAAVAAVGTAVPLLWLELVPLAWAAPFVLIYLVVIVPLLFSEARRRRGLL